MSEKRIQVGKVLQLPESTPHKLARVVVYKAAKDEGPWEVVDPKDHPDFIKDPDVMGKMLAGFTAQAPGAAIMYTAKMMSLTDAV
jgi:hypothetical protein